MPGPSESFPLDETSLHRLLERPPAEDPAQIREILARARELGGLDEADLPVLMALRDPDLLDERFEVVRVADGDRRDRKPADRPARPAPSQEGRAFGGRRPRKWTTTIQGFVTSRAENT